MTWRIRIRHRSGYHYANPVTSSYNEARITPLSTPRQLCLEAKVEVTPVVRPSRYWDYWGTSVDAFDIQVAHTDLSVTGTSVVETATPDPSGLGVGWDTIRAAATLDRYAELLAPTRYVPFDERIREAAAEIGGAARTPTDAAMAAVELVRDALHYAPGATSVRTSATEAWTAGQGVCQDFAHLTLALLRSTGVPCRYVSGYFHPNADARIGQAVIGESHAWVEWWDGEWRSFDPTNGVPVGERHVLVGRGRDYADVAPLKGIFHGGPAEQLAVEVELTRVG